MQFLTEQHTSNPSLHIPPIHSLPSSSSSSTRTTIGTSRDRSMPHLVPEFDLLSLDDSHQPVQSNTATSVVSIQQHPPPTQPHQPVQSNTAISVVSIQQYPPPTPIQHQRDVVWDAFTSAQSTLDTAVSHRRADAPKDPFEEIDRNISSSSVSIVPAPLVATIESLSSQSTTIQNVETSTPAVLNSQQHGVSFAAAAGQPQQSAASTDDDARRESNLFTGTIRESTTSTRGSSKVKLSHEDILAMFDTPASRPPAPFSS